MMIEKKDELNKLTTKLEILKKILESITNPLYVISTKDYTIEIANSAAKAKIALGQDTSCITCHSLTHKSERPCWQNGELCPLKIILETKKSTVVEHIHHDKDGLSRNYEVHGYPIFDKEGNIAQVIEYSIDITKRKAMELKLKKNLKDLELFREATLLREEKMLELKKEINEAFKELGKPEPYDLSSFEDQE